MKHSAANEFDRFFLRTNLTGLRDSGAPPKLNSSFQTGLAGYVAPVCLVVPGEPPGDPSPETTIRSFPNPRLQPPPPPPRPRRARPDPDPAAPRPPAAAVHLPWARSPSSSSPALDRRGAEIHQPVPVLVSSSAGKHKTYFCVVECYNR